MQPEDVEIRLQAVLAQLEVRRQAAKKALDDAWASDPATIEPCLDALRQAQAQYTEFASVSQKALPLLQALNQIQMLRTDAALHLERLTMQAEDSRRLKASLVESDLETMAQIPPSVGEVFDLGLLAEDQLAQIRAAHEALSTPRGVAPTAPQPSPNEAAPLPEQPESSAASPPGPPTVDVTLEEWTESVQPPPEDAAPEAPAEPVGLPGDEALDAMFEEAVTAEAEAALTGSVPPPSEAPAAAAPAAVAEPPVEAEPLGEQGFPEEGSLAGTNEPPGSAEPAEPAEPVAAPPPARDPLDELLTRAGFEG